VPEWAEITVFDDYLSDGSPVNRLYDVKPLPTGQVLRSLDNVLVTPHIGYVTEDTGRLFYGYTFGAIVELLDKRPNYFSVR
jgi:phosphoglycerate dehydrogenase-like enzyme